MAPATISENRARQAKFAETLDKIDRDAEKSGNLRMYEMPEVKQAQRYAAALIKLEAEFGLTPSGRASLNVGGDDPMKDDPLAQLYARRAERN